MLLDLQALLFICVAREKSQNDVYEEQAINNSISNQPFNAFCIILARERDSNWNHDDDEKQDQHHKNVPNNLQVVVLRDCASVISVLGKRISIEIPKHVHVSLDFLESSVVCTLRLVLKNLC